MKNIKTSTVTEQVTSFLRDEIVSGKWKRLMPGREQLASELGVSAWSVQRALENLEREGLLAPKGGGKRREIVLKSGIIKPRASRIGIFPFDSDSAGMAIFVDLKHQLIEAGHAVSTSSRSLTELKMNVSRIERVAKSYDVDAWVVVSATRDVLAWFDAQATPTFAFWGGHLKMSIAGTGPKKTPATMTALDQLISLGHRRIIYLVRPQHIKNPPIVALQAFIDKMESHQIPVGNYNMPIWEETPEGLRQCLESLFATTPPTALIIDEPEIFLAVKDHLASRQILAPRDVSLICADPSRSFAWFQPSISHLAWSAKPMVRHAVRWAAKVSQGQNDRRKSSVKAHFIEGGSIGPPKHKSK